MSMKSIATASALLLAANTLAACGASGNVGSWTGSGAESSSRTITTRGLAAHDTGDVAQGSAQHGPEVESGAVITVTDGNVHMSYPAGATITRMADGVIVISHGRARKFSPAAVAVESGSYHVYAPVTH